MTTKFYIEFIDNSKNCNFVLQSKWFNSQQIAEKWLIDEFDFVDFEKFSIFVMCADFDDDGDFGDITQSRQITKEEYLKIKK